MISIPTEEGFPAKQEASSSHDHSKTAKTLSNSSTPWLRLKDPRIVRVSGAFGGKDRHSKVRTIRGLRDRRVRLSLPTAIQLYDLQELLGLNQPSKVIDWLLNAAKNEIDELPPLPLIPPQSFVVNHLNNSTSELEGSIGLSRPKFPNLDVNWRINDSKEAARDQIVPDEKEIWTNSTVEGKQRNGGYHCKLTNFPASQTGIHGFITSRESGIPQDSNAIPLQYSTFSLSTGSRLFPWPDQQVTQSYFPTNITTTLESDSRHANHFQMMSSSSSQNLLQHSLTPSLYSISQSMRPFQFSTNPNFFPSANDGGDHKE